MANEEQIKRRKWKWIDHILRKDHSAIEKQVFDWNLQGSRKRGRSRIS